MRRMAAFLAALLLLTGCQPAPPRAPSEQAALTQALQGRTTKWEVLARSGPVKTGEYALLYRYAGRAATVYGLLTGYPGGWHNQLLGPAPQGRQSLLTVAETPAHRVAFVGGLLGDPLVGGRAVYQLPWQQSSRPATATVLETIELPKGQPLTLPVPFSVVGSDARSSYSGQVPEPPLLRQSPAASCTSQEPPPDTPVGPLSLKPSRSLALPGETFTITIQGEGAERTISGVDRYLQCWDGRQWVNAYMLTAAWGPSAAPYPLPPNWAIPDLGVPGPGPETLQLPPGLLRGWYRIKRVVSAPGWPTQTLYARVQVANWLDGARTQADPGTPHFPRLLAGELDHLTAIRIDNQQPPGTKTLTDPAQLQAIAGALAGATYVGGGESASDSAGYRLELQLGAATGGSAAARVTLQYTPTAVGANLVDAQGRQRWQVPELSGLLAPLLPRPYLTAQQVQTLGRQRAPRAEWRARLAPRGDWPAPGDDVYLAVGITPDQHRLALVLNPVTGQILHEEPSQGIEGAVAAVEAYYRLLAQDDLAVAWDRVHPLAQRPNPDGRPDEVYQAFLAQRQSPPPQLTRVVQATWERDPWKFPGCMCPVWDAVAVQVQLTDGRQRNLHVAPDAHGTWRLFWQQREGPA